MAGTTVVLLQCVEAAAKGLATFHQGFQDKHRGEQGVPFRQVHAEAHPTGLFTADQHLTRQHLAGDVLEAHCQLEDVTALGLRHQAHQIGTAHRFHHRSRQLAGPGEMVDQQGHQQLGAAESTVFIHRGDAIAITVEHQSHSRGAGSRGLLHRCDQVAEIRRQGFRRMAAEQGITIGADLFHQL